MKEILTEISEVYPVYSRRRSDGSVTLMWIETDANQAERDCNEKEDAEYDWYFSTERIYGNVLLRKYE